MLFRVAAGLWAVAVPGLALAADGLPQLDASFYPSQLFWLVVSFGALYGVMVVGILPRLNNVQQARTSQRARDLAEAREAQEKAKALIATGEKQLAEARAKASADMAAVMQQAQNDAAKAKADQTRELMLRLKSAETDIATMRARALAAIDQVALDVAVAMAQKLVAAPISAEDWNQAKVANIKDAA
ncbi:MAG: hypothetical protein EBZ69_02030 [Alphaproteobacteria bacterium]|nr:hypothetical protein [Alphaproteobacteria bacterium]